MISFSGKTLCNQLCMGNKYTDYLKVGRNVMLINAYDQNPLERVEKLFEQYCRI